MINVRNLDKAGYKAGEWRRFEDESLLVRSWTKRISDEIRFVVEEVFFKDEHFFELLPESIPEELRVNSVTKLLELEAILRSF